MVAVIMNTMINVRGYHLVPSNIQPREVICIIIYSSGSFRFRLASKTGNFKLCDIGMSY